MIRPSTQRARPLVPCEAASRWSSSDGDHHHRDPGRAFAAGDQRRLQTARKAAVSSEINQLAKALANFKSKYGDYPPSRFLAVENGNYSSYLGSRRNASLTGDNLDPTRRATETSLSVSSPSGRVAALRKFWPEGERRTARYPNARLRLVRLQRQRGDKSPDAPYILHGHECLVFFLGGCPSTDSETETFGMNGFGKTRPTRSPTASPAITDVQRQPAAAAFRVQSPGRCSSTPTVDLGNDHAHRHPRLLRLAWQCTAAGRGGRPAP